MFRHTSQFSKISARYSPFLLVELCQQNLLLFLISLHEHHVSTDDQKIVFENESDKGR